MDTKFDKLKDTVPRNKGCISAKAKDAGQGCAEPPQPSPWQEYVVIHPEMQLGLLSFIPIWKMFPSGATPDRGKIRAKLCNKLVWDLGLEELQVLLETTL